MAALDFPPAPTVGQKYPVSPAAGVPQYSWDGEKWITGATVIAGVHVLKAGDTMTGALVLPADPTAALQAATKQYVDARFQRIDLGGLSTVDVTVPAGATAAKLNGRLYHSTSTASAGRIYVSVAPGVFLTTVNDYIGNGMSHFGILTPTAVVNTLNSSQAAITFGSAHDLLNIPEMFEATMITKRSATTKHFGVFSIASGYNSTNGYNQFFVYAYVNNTSAGSALSLLAFRLASSIAEAWSADSYLNVEWL